MIENATAGHLDRAVVIATEHLATAPQWTEEFPTIELYFQLTRSWALILSGELGDAQVHAELGYATALEENAEFPRGTWSFVRGVIDVARGRPHSATRALQEATSAFEIADRGFLRPSCTFLAMAAALEGCAAAGERAPCAPRHDAKPSYDGLFGIDLARGGRLGDRGTGELSVAAAEAQRRRHCGRTECVGARGARAPRRRSVRAGGRRGRTRSRRSSASSTESSSAAWRPTRVRSLTTTDPARRGCPLVHISDLRSFCRRGERGRGARGHRRAGERASAFTSLDRAHAARRPLRVGPDARARVGRPARRPHGTRARDRRPGPRRPDESRDRRTARHHDPDGRQPPRTRLRQARSLRPPGARRTALGRRAL